MAESARRVRNAAHPAVETLEGRTVLSVSANLSAGGLPLDLGQYGPSNSYLTPQSGEVDLTLTRPSANARGALTVGVDTTGSYTQALPLNARTPRMTGNILSLSSAGPDGRIVQRILRTTGPNRSTLPIVPIQGNYRFAPGQTSLTIPIRLNPRFIPPNGNTDVLVQVNDPTMHGAYFSGPWMHLQIVASLDQIPPRVIGSSRTPGAITLTFSKPMNPATTEDVTNYQVFGPNDDGIHPEPLKSAVYNPATQTVTLTPTVPLTQSGFTVKSANAGKSPTDLQGNAANFGIPF